MKNKRIMTIDEIKEKVSSVLEKYPVRSCTLFGSYSRGEATKKSDVDLAIDQGKVTGFAFYGMILAIEEALGKPVDVVTICQIVQSQSLLSEILNDGIKIYRKEKVKDNKHD